MKKSMASLLAVYGLALAGMDLGAPQRIEEDEGKFESENDRKIRLTKDLEIRNKKRGLSPFKYGEEIIWAINQKNADIKAKKSGLLSS